MRAGTVFNGLLISALSLACVNEARAFADVCELSATRISASIGVPASDISVYQRRLARECELKKTFDRVQAAARHRMGLQLDEVSEYQALRYVRRSEYESARYNETPVELIYQPLRADAAKPNSEKSSLIWRNFLAGIAQLPAERTRIMAGGKFTVEDIKRIHVGFYQYSNEVGDYAHQPFPGFMRKANFNDRYWWKLKDDQVSAVRHVIDEQTVRYQTLGLVALPDASDREPDIFQSVILQVKPYDGGGYAIFEGDSRANQQHLARLFDFIDSMLSQARQGQHMVRNGHLLTPGQVAFLAQQDFVQIHPFSEGNGRTSRFIQELILTSFGLPHGASGDLMDHDVLTNHDGYYDRAMEMTEKLMTAVDGCIDTAATTSARLPFACRYLALQ